MVAFVLTPKLVKSPGQRLRQGSLICTQVQSSPEPCGASAGEAQALLMVTCHQQGALGLTSQARHSLRLGLFS